MVNGGVLLICALVFLAMWWLLRIRLIEERNEAKARQMDQMEEFRQSYAFAVERSINVTRAIAYKHKITLVNKSRQLIYKDDYGKYKFESYWNELEYFLRHL
jgi:hypothetical protein